MRANWNPPRPLASRRVDALTKFQTLQTSKNLQTSPQGGGTPLILRWLWWVSYPQVALMGMKCGRFLRNFRGWKEFGGWLGGVCRMIGGELEDGVSIENLFEIYLKCVWKSIENLSKIYRTSIENLSKFYRKSNENLSKIYRKSIENLSSHPPHIGFRIFFRNFGQKRKKMHFCRFFIDVR